MLRVPLGRIFCPVTDADDLLLEAERVLVELGFEFPNMSEWDRWDYAYKLISFKSGRMLKAVEIYALSGLASEDVKSLSESIEEVVFSIDDNGQVSKYLNGERVEE